MTKLNYKREFNSLTIDELKAILTAYDPSINQVQLKFRSMGVFDIRYVTFK